MGLLSGVTISFWLSLALLSVPSHGIAEHIVDSIGLSTQGSSAFRIRFDATASPLASPMVCHTTPNSAWQVTHSTTYGEGIESAGIGTIFANGSTLHLISADRVIVTITLVATGAVRLSRRIGTNVLGTGSSMAGHDGFFVADNTTVTPTVDNTAVFVPYYYSENGYGALGAVDATVGSKLRVNFTTWSDAIEWRYDDVFELYLMPAMTPDDATAAFAALTGPAPLPPLYTFGFMASRWGWSNASYLEHVLTEFRQGNYPVDLIICDFEWFANTSDYGFNESGEPWYHDFNYSAALFPSEPLPLRDPADRLLWYRHWYQVRFAGIRKPRLGNSELLDFARTQPSWLLPTDPEGGYALGRDLNFSTESLRAWYADQVRHYVDDGVAFFWNDEGETDYFTFYYWNIAERTLTPSSRFFTINRAFTPGLAALGAAAWTGDISPTWSNLQRTPVVLMNWGLASMPYATCDTGGFAGETSAELLTRWMQLSVFSPIMRVHSTLDATPHWPFLWGEPYASTMRDALNLRYQLLPYHYSLAYQQTRTGTLRLMRPLFFDYAQDENTVAWLDGDILVAPVTHSAASSVQLVPPCDVFQLNTSILRPANQTITYSVNISTIPLFARVGSIIVFGPICQSTDEYLSIKNSSDLKVHVYAGANATFQLYEDDGLTSDLSDGRLLRFDWHEAYQRLDISTVSPGNSKGPYFTSALVTLFQANRVPVTFPCPLTFADSTSLAFEEHTSSHHFVAPPRADVV